MRCHIRQHKVGRFVNPEYSGSYLLVRRVVKAFERSNQRRHAAELVMPHIENICRDSHFFPHHGEDTTLVRAVHLYERAGFTFASSGSSESGQNR